MNKLDIELQNNVTLLHSNKLKARHFLWNTLAEYRIGYYLRERCEENPKFVLDVSWEQDGGDFTIGNDSFEYKENRGALSSSELSLEVLNTATGEPSGLLKSYQDKVDYFAVYLPVYNNYNGKYKHMIDTLLVFRTYELWHWVKSKEELQARNNNFLHSNALCYKLPVSYIDDSLSLNKTLAYKITIPEQKLKDIKIPREIYSLFQDE